MSTSGLYFFVSSVLIAALIVFLEQLMFAKHDAVEKVLSCLLARLLARSFVPPRHFFINLSTLVKSHTLLPFQCAIETSKSSRIRELQILDSVPFFYGAIYAITGFSTIFSLVIASAIQHVMITRFPMWTQRKRKSHRKMDRN